MANSEVRTRFAPSPTGFVHVGGLRTALFAWAYAKNQNGKFILRIEDTDQKRKVEGSFEHILESLNWLGISWDEEPFIQSEHLEVYKEWAEKLISKGLAYNEQFSQDELDVLRDKSRAEKRPFLYREHRPNELKIETDWYGNKALRFKIPKIEPTKWYDAVRGELHAGEDALDDLIIIKADGYPTYNFAHIIDDHLMGISHVMRGEEFIPSMPKYLALYEALDIKVPKFVTMPPILAPSGNKKLSKRDGAKDALDYREEGILPEALLNFVASLGWNDGTEQEIYSPDEIVAKFSLKRIQRSGARFNEEKLNWMNWQHFSRLLEENTPQALEHIGIGEINQMIEEAARLSATKAASVDDFKTQLAIFTDEPSFLLSADNLQQVDANLDAKTAERYLEEASLELTKLDDFTAPNIEMVLRQKMAGLEAAPRAFLNLIRWKISGQKVSPNLFEMIAVLGRDKVLKRINS